MANIATAQIPLRYPLINSNGTMTTPWSLWFISNQNSINNNLTFTANGFLVTNATGNLQALGPIADGQLLIGSTGSFPQVGQLNPGSGISIANGSGTISITNIGVTSLAGTPNEIIISGSTGAVTLSTPQPIDVTSSPTFFNLTLTNPLTVANGGTGLSTLTSHNVLLGEGSGNVGFAAPGTSGQMLLSSGAASDPVFGNNPAINGGSITNTTIDNTPIGNTTAATGKFTVLTTQGFIANTVTKSSAYTALSTDYTIRADGTAAGFTITLPASPTTGQIFNVKKIDSTANVITISGNGNNIDGTATKTISTQYTSLVFQFNGSTWDLI